MKQLSKHMKGVQWVLRQKIAWYVGRIGGDLLWSTGKG
jgi:hypothetical protein